jgi:catechol 2,3-dioxygenase-like lactoylglutathione lyase family enzyme
MITDVDFVGVPTSDLERSVAFYGETLGLRRDVYYPDRNFAEFQVGGTTLSVYNPAAMGIGELQPNPNPLALRVDGDVHELRAELEGKGVEFMGDVLDTGVCHMAFFADPDGNALMLHRRYAPRVTEHDG